MPSISRLLAVTVACAAAALSLPPPAGAASACPADTPAGTTIADTTVRSFDRTEIAVTVFRPGGVCAEAPTPVVLHGHGWAGSRHRTLTAEVGPLVEAGYGVVSIDARGHGESGGQSRLMHRDHEVGDYRAVLDWVHDELGWVARDADPAAGKDVVAGAFGMSYGGAFQLMTAAYDERLDALVPMATWNDLLRALAPNGVPRSGWMTALLALGEANTNPDPRLRRWFVETAASGDLPAEARRHLAGSSPASSGRPITAPALLIQGLPDTLFPLNEGVANYRALRAVGVPARLLGVNGGHVVPVAQPFGVNAPPRDGIGTCVPDVTAHLIDFLDAHLRGDEGARGRLEAVPPVALSTEQDGCVTAPDWPVHDREVDVHLPLVAAPTPGGSLLLPLLTAEEPFTVAGVPRLRGSVAPGAGDDRLFLSLVLQRADGGHMVHDQVTPVRTGVVGPDGTVDAELAGVATELTPGDRLLLRVDGMNEQFAGVMTRRPGLALLREVTVTLPVVDEQARPTGGAPGLPRRGHSGDRPRPQGPREAGDDAGAGAVEGWPVALAPVVAAPETSPGGALPATGGGRRVLAAGLLSLVAGLVAAAGRPRPASTSARRRPRARPGG